MLDSVRDIIYISPLELTPVLSITQPDSEKVASLVYNSTAIR